MSWKPKIMSCLLYLEEENDVKGPSVLHDENRFGVFNAVHEKTKTENFPGTD